MDHRTGLRSHDAAQDKDFSIAPIMNAPTELSAKTFLTFFSLNLSLFNDSFGYQGTFLRLKITMNELRKLLVENTSQKTGKNNCNIKQKQPSHRE